MPDGNYVAKDAHFEGSPDVTKPANHAFTITPSATEFTRYTRGIYVGGAGNITLTTTGGDSVTLVGVLAGSIIPIRAKKVTAATATDLIGLY